MIAGGSEAVELHRSVPLRSGLDWVQDWIGVQEPHQGREYATAGEAGRHFNARHTRS